MMDDMSSSSIFDLQNDFNLNPNLMKCSLDMITFYESRKCSHTYRENGNAYTIAKNVLDDVILKGSEQLYNEYIEAKISGHSTKLNFELLECVVLLEGLHQENLPVQTSCDIEPVSYLS